MRRILTSLPYEKRIGLPSAANGLTLTDSVRRTLLIPVADTHLDDTLESAAGRLVKCDDSGSLLADAKSVGWTEWDWSQYLLGVDDNVVIQTMPSGWKQLYLWRSYHGAISSVSICNASGEVLQELPFNRFTLAKGVIGRYYIQAIGQPGVSLNILSRFLR